MRIYEAGWKIFEVIIFPFKKKGGGGLADVSNYIVERKRIFFLNFS